MSGSTPPPGGMQRIPFPLESYQHPSSPLSAKFLLNMMAEQLPADARTQATLVPTPGLVADQVLGAGPIQAMADGPPGVRYFVSGTHFYRILYPIGAPVVTDLGDIGTPDSGTIPTYATMYTIASGDLAAVVCVPPRAYTCGHNVTDPLNQIGGDFPGAATVAYFDGYHVFTDYANDAGFFISKLLDPTSYDALDFAFSDGLPNVLRRIMPYRTDLWMMGDGGIEIWYDSGDLDFPFRRRMGGVLPFNIGSPRSIATGDNSVWWVSNTHMVFRTNGYQATRVSTHAIEQIIRYFSPTNIVSAFSYSEMGHTFYVLNFPQRTLVYDSATKAWHDRASEGADGRWRPNAVTTEGSDLLFGDALSGQLFRSSVNAADSGLEASTPLTRQIVFPPIWAGTNRAFCSRLEVEMESGDTRLTDGTITLDWSDDGGFTWTGGPRVMTALQLAGRRQRVFTTRLGSFRQRVFRLTLSGAVTVYAADAAITGGAS